MKAMIIDIETLPLGAEAHRELMGDRWREMPPEHALAECEPPAPVEMRAIPRNLRDPAKIAARMSENAAIYKRECAGWLDEHHAAAFKWWRGGSLRPSRGRVYSIGWTVEGHSHVAVAETEAAEVGALDELYEKIMSYRPDVLVAWNAPFDTGFLWQRAIRHGHPIAGCIAEPHYSVTAKLKRYGRKPMILDAMDLWPLPARKAGEGSMNAACEALGIARPDNPIDGSQVLDAYMDGRGAKIVAHNRADVRDLWQVWEQLRHVWGI